MLFFDLLISEMRHSPAALCLPAGFEKNSLLRVFRKKKKEDVLKLSVRQLHNQANDVFLFS